MYRSSIVSLACCVVLAGLLGGFLCGAASAATITEVVPVTFTLPSPEQVTMQIICTHAGTLSESWDYYTNHPDLSGTLSANLQVNFNNVTGHVDVTGIQWNAGTPGALVFSDYTKRIETVATMNMMNLHAALYSANMVPVSGDSWSNTGIQLLFNDGVISWNATPGTRYLSSAPLTCSLIDPDLEGGDLSVNGHTGTPTSIAGDTATYGIEISQYITSSISETILTVKWLSTTFSGGIGTNGEICATGTFQLHGIVPEPTTFMMVAGLAAFLAGYGWWRRRRSRTRALW